MKTLSLITIIFLFVLSSCNFGVKTNGRKVTFGIYEVVNVNRIPQSIIDTLKAKNDLLENNPQLSIVGYIQKADSSFLQLDLSRDNLELVKTLYTVDKDNKYYAIVAIKPNPVIDNSDIKNTKSNSNNVEIYFNLKGANKWADLTKKNIGKTLAFIIDYKVYTMPVINAEIRNGVALINGLENETFSKNISESLNSSISE
jgi:preprotein translocase subunit SecD